jgi:hypothetical protein
VRKARRLNGMRGGYAIYRNYFKEGSFSDLHDYNYEMAVIRADTASPVNSQP